MGAVASIVLVGGYLLLVSWIGRGPTLLEFRLGLTCAWAVVGVVLHEVFHGVGFRVAGAPWSGIRFGVMWKFLLPYAACSYPMSVERYRFAVVLPVWVTGFLPWFIGAVSGNQELAVAGALLTAGAAGDFLVWREARSSPPGTLVIDLPEEIGFAVVGPQYREARIQASDRAQTSAN